MINYHSKGTKQALLQQTKQGTKQMEEETKRMEVRLQELKLAMENERQQRTQSGNAGFWSRGQAGALSNYKSVSAGAKKPAPPTSGGPSAGASVRKVKLIKDEPLNLPERLGAVPGTLAYLANARGAAAMSEEPRRPAGGRGRGAAASGAAASGGIPKCGQCEDRPAAVLCPECAEEYCARCFAAFHLKGALRKHRSMPLSAVSTPRQALSNAMTAAGEANHSQAPQRRRPAVASAATDATTGEGNTPAGVFEDKSRESRRDMVRQLLRSPEGGSGSLLSGSVDERQNAAEFQRALAEWRQPTQQQQKEQQQPQQRRQQQQRHHQTASHGTGTEDDFRRRQATIGQEIKFTPSLTYAEQLLLQRHRRAEVGRMPSYRGGGTDGAAATGANDDRGGVFDEIRSMQRQLTGVETPRSTTTGADKFVSKQNNRTKVDDLFPEQRHQTTEAVATADEPAEAVEKPPPPQPTSARTPRQSHRPRSGLEWTTAAASRKSSARPQTPTDRPGEHRSRLTAASSGGLSGLAARARQSLEEARDAAASLEPFLLLGVDGNFSGETGGVGGMVRFRGNGWSSRPSSAASVTATTTPRPTSSSSRAADGTSGNSGLSHRFYSLTGGRSWRPDASREAPGVDQLRRIRAETDAAQRLLARPPGESAMLLEDVEIEAEARVVAAMPLSRPVSARSERLRSRLNGDRPGTANGDGRLPAQPEAAREELDVTADYLQDDVEHLTRLAVELAETEATPDGSDKLKQNSGSYSAADTRALDLLSKELTQEDKDRVLQEWDDTDMNRMDTERCDDQEDVRQLH